MSRSEVHARLGEPQETTDGLRNGARTFVKPSEVAITDRHRYSGKVNYPEEGGGQATVNALTLGTAEVVLIPLTLADIASRSASTTLVDVFYNPRHEIIDFRIGPTR